MPSELHRLGCPHLSLDLTRIGPAVLFTGAMSRDQQSLAFARACPGGGRSFCFGEGPSETPAKPAAAGI